MSILATTALIATAAPLAWVRIAPSDAARWHVDPMQVTRVPKPPHEGGWLVRPGKANAEPIVFATNPDALLSAFDEVARATPRTKLLAGGPDEGQATYISRSTVIGFPDYTSVRAIPDEDGAALVIWARNRFGKSDFGANRARVEDWLARIETHLQVR